MQQRDRPPGQAGAAGAAVPAHWAALRARLPRPLVLTNGVFDLLHAGHVECLQAARQLGAALVVGVNTDASARRLGKGPGRPLNDQSDRVRVLAALSCVTEVVLFDSDTPLQLIAALRPEVYVKGGDYNAEQLLETGLVAKWGGRTVIVPRMWQRSTSLLVQRIAALRG